MIVTPVFARIGETIEQLDKRYGKPVGNGREIVETRRYLFKGFTIVVGLENGISQCEVYRKDPDSRMSESELYTLMVANAGKSPWVREPDENLNQFTYWSVDKKTRVAIYALKTHQLLITSKVSLPKFVHLLDASRQNQLDGF